MKNNRIDELGKSRVLEIMMADICTSTMLAVFALWVVWISTSMLIHFAK